VPVAGDIAEVPVPEVDPDDDEPRQRLATLTVEHMDGLRVDRLTLRLLEPDPAEGATGEQR
jgi:hypothetical protein